MRFTLKSRLLHNRFHDGISSLRRRNQQVYFFFGGNRKSEEFFGVFRPGSFCLDHSAAARARAACRIHNHIAVAFVRDYKNQFVICFDGHSFYPFRLFQTLVRSQYLSVQHVLQTAPAADAAEWNRHRDAVPRNINVHSAL